MRWHTSVQATLAALTQGPSLRSELYCLGPSSLSRPHPSHSPAQHDFVAERLIRTALAVSLLGPRRPASGSELSLIVLYRPVALWDPGMSIGCMHPVPSPTTLAYRPLGRVSALPTSPTLRFSWGRRFRGFTTVRSRYDLPICLVGIELGRASCRRGVTSLTLSVARWVHIPAVTTFPEAPQ